MGKGKPNKTRNEPTQNVQIKEPDFSVKTEKLTPAERKLQAQKERDRKEEEAAQLLQKQKAEQKQKKTKPKQQNKQPAKNVKNEETDFTPKREKLTPVKEKMPVQREREDKDVQDWQKQKTERKQEQRERPRKDVDADEKVNIEDNSVDKMDSAWDWDGDDDWRKKRETVSKPNYSSPHDKRSTGNYSNYNSNDGKNDKDYNRRSSNYNFNDGKSDKDNRRTSNYNYNLNDGKNDKDFQDFLHKKSNGNGKVREITGDLFVAPDDYSLAHCVAEDFSMGAGIAKEFKAKFKSVSKLLDQNAQTGGLAFLEHKARFIYYLVTKKVSRGKPTLYTLWQSLIKLREHIVANKVTKLAIPQIGCGLDRLNWNDVKNMLEYIFNKIEIDIVVYILEFNANETPTPSKPLKKCYVVHEPKPLVEIQSETGLIFLGTEDSSISPEMQSLAGKYDFIDNYKKQRKSTGDVIKIVDRNEYLYGLIIRRTSQNKINFGDFEKCLYNLQKQLKTDNTFYIGLQAFVEAGDEAITEKLVHLMSYHLKEVEIWVCWPKELEHLCPPGFKNK